MRLVTLLSISILLGACGSAASSSETPVTRADSTGEENAEPGGDAVVQTDEGALCAGPYHRATNGAIACPNRDGGWSSLTGCYGCTDDGGQCLHPAYAVNDHPSACDRTGAGPCPEPTSVEAGSCDWPWRGRLFG